MSTQGPLAAVYRRADGAGEGARCQIRVCVRAFCVRGLDTHPAVAKKSEGPTAVSSQRRPSVSAVSKSMRGRMAASHVRVVRSCATVWKSEWLLSKRTCNKSPRAPKRGGSSRERGRGSSVCGAVRAWRGAEAGAGEDVHAKGDAAQ